MNNVTDEMVEAGQAKSAEFGISIGAAPMRAALTAALAVGGYAFVRWHVFRVSPGVSANTPTILVARQSADDRYVMERNARITMPLDTFAWADMPPPPAWAQTASPVTSAQSPEASLVAQAEPPISDSYLIKNVPTDKWFLAPMHGLTKNPRQAHRFTRVAADEKVKKSAEENLIFHESEVDFGPVAQATGDAHEAPVAEPAPVWTREKEALLDRMQLAIRDHIRSGGKNDATARTEIEQLARAAFPDPAP